MADGTDVFAALSKLVKRFGTSSQGLPAQKEIVKTEKLISFSLLDREYVIALSEVNEVLEVPKCTKLPRVKSWVIGVANVRGRLLPVIDFAEFLGNKLTGPARGRRVLVFEVANNYLGLIVDHVNGIRALPVDSYQPASEKGPLGSFIDGKFADGAHSIELFRPQRLIENNQFMTVSV
jgi:twitching motility protein PilI